MLASKGIFGESPEGTETRISMYPDSHRSLLLPLYNGLGSEKYCNIHLKTGKFDFWNIGGIFIMLGLGKNYNLSRSGLN